MTALWTSADAAAATLGCPAGPFAAHGLSIDTRTLKPGDMFVALRGERRDGHDFVRAAFSAGAVAAMVQRPLPDAPRDAPILMVASVQRGLEDLARAARARSRAEIVAVTGSAGKTTTKEMLRLALGALGPTHVSAASYNNHWGVPLSVASLAPGCRFGVFEIGMNHFGEIRALVGLVRPHVALVTTVAPAHFEFFGNCEAIADAKSEIFEGISAGGTALIPADSPYTERLESRARQAHVGRILSFGAAAGAEARLRDAETMDDSMRVKADVLGREVHFHLRASGIHNAMNALAALLVVAALDGDVLNAAAALADFSPLKGRGARIDLALGRARVRLIDESYNANPASMAAALGNLASAVAGRRIAVLGDMLELGQDSGRLHADLADAVEVSRADLVFLCGPHMAALWERVPPSRRGAYGAGSADIADAVVTALQDNDVVLVKGSLGSRMSVIVEALRARGA